MKISVVCPFFNEELILESSIRSMMRNLSSLKEEWELIIVNDGSRDRSPEIARNLEKEYPRLRVLGYAVNRGRGFAIRAGIAEAKGDIVVTTEIDSSWGDDIVQRIIQKFYEHPEADIVIASPHLPGGGYKNVPKKRVFLSTFGNFIVRSGLSYAVTMNTGMTRGYKRQKFLDLPLLEDEKEMHLEIVNKALAFGYRIYEIPAILEWKDHKFTAQSQAKRKSSANINKLIRTHVLFSLLAAPFRYLYGLSLCLAGGSIFFFIWALVNFAKSKPSINLLIISFILAMFGLLVFGIGVLSQQGRELQQELWRIQRELRNHPLCAPSDRDYPDS